MCNYRYLEIYIKIFNFILSQECMEPPMHFSTNLHDHSVDGLFDG